MKAQLYLVLLSFFFIHQLLNAQGQRTYYSPTIDPGNPDAFFTGEFKGTTTGSLILDSQLQRGISRHDSSYLWNFDNTVAIYDLSERELYHYDADGRVVSILVQNRVSDGWVNNYVSKYTYDELGLLAVYASQYWSNNQWLDLFRYTYTYDEHHRLIEELVESTLSGPLANYLLFLYEYNDQDLLISQIIREWKTIAWANSVFRQNTYDDQNRIIYQLRQDWESGAWENSRDFSYTYDTLSNLQEYLSRVWSVSDWMTEYRNVYQYDLLNNRLKLQRQYHIGGNFWSLAYQTLYSYDMHSNLITETGQSFASNDWINTSMSRYGYSENHQQISIVNMSWENAWVPQDSFYRYYNSLSSVVDHSPIHHVVLYPNPANDFVTLPKDRMNGIKSITVYDLHGRLIKEVSSSNLASGGFEVNDLPVGQYTVLIDTQNGLSVARFVKAE